MCCIFCTLWSMFTVTFTQHRVVQYNFTVFRTVSYWYKLMCCVFCTLWGMFTVTFTQHRVVQYNFTVFRTLF